MPLIKVNIETKIEALINSLQSGDPTKKDPAATKKEFISGLADIIIDTIKTADITIATGLVQTQGSPAAQANIAPIIVLGGLS